MDQLYVWYFIIHTFISIVIDSAIALPEEWLFGFQAKLAEFHMQQNNDLLFAARPLWLRAYVWVELLLQVPFFVWAAIDLHRGNRRVWPAVLVYSTLAATTTFACLVEVLAIDVTPVQKFRIFMCYFPTFAIPMWLLIDFWGRIYPLVVKSKVE